MKLTKKLEAEIIQVMDTYWDSYLEGDLKTWASFLPDDYKNIGTTQEEIWNTRKEIYDYTTAVFEQMVGMAELREKQTQIIPYAPYFMVHELGDLFIKTGNDWSYYAKLRLSSLLIKDKDGWKILHQHGSYPDAKTQEGEAFAVDALKAENIKLQEAVRNRTIELEHKNRELEIETALERVRAVAMGMNKPGDLLNICEVVFNELQTLGFDALRNAIIHSFEDDKKIFTDYDYSDIAGGTVAQMPYTGNPVLENFIEKIRETKDSFFEIKVSGKELESWKAFRRTTDMHDDPQLDKAKAVYYYVYSVGSASIGISSFHAISPEQLGLLKRFRNVFDLAYRRYDDIQKAEAQAREAKINLALERVRARTMAMHNSEELADISFELFKQVQLLGVTTWHCAFNIYDEGQNSSTEWATNEGGAYPMYKTPREGIFLRYYEIGQTGETLHIETIGEDKAADHYAYLCTLPGAGEQLVKLRDEGVAFPTSQIDHVAYFKYGYLLFITYEPVPDAYDIFRRFAKNFEQTYTRFLDLQKAQAQTREANIEAALEKVRSRSLAMHTTNELGEVVTVIVEKLQDLGVVLDANGVILCTYFRESKDVMHWIASPDYSVAGSYLLPYFEHPIFDAAWQSRESGADYFSKAFSIEEKNSFFEYAFEHSDYKYFPEEFKQWIFQNDQHILSFAWQKNSAILIPSHTGVLPSADDEAILKRFSKVFEQAYTRFLDLQKAEAQAREAQIETALEKVRSRSLAMHMSDELNEVVAILFEKLKELQIPATAVGIAIHIDDSKDLNAFVCGENEAGLVITNYRLPFFENKITKDISDTLDKQLDFFVGNYSKEEKNSFYEYLFEHSAIKDVPDDIKTMIFESPTYTISMVAVKNAVFNINDFEGKVLAENEVDIIKRFAKVFDQAYTRFLDLQKAEAQAREANIEVALERVRARSMAMHQSTELAETSSVLFQQIEELGFETWSCGFCIWQKDELVEVWMGADSGGLLPPMMIPYKEDPTHNDINEAHLQGAVAHEKIWEGEGLEEHYTYLRTIPSVANAIKVLEDAGLSLPDRQCYYVGFFKQGYLLLITKEPNPELNDLSKRFAGVFEQTYTRFLDLQKAEAQAREAQIEAALERVRSRSLAMHSSSELVEASDVMLAELKKLDIHALRIGICTINKETEAAEIWSRSEVHGKLEKRILGVVPKGVHPVFDNMVKAFKENKPVFSSTRAGNAVKEYYEALSPYLSYPLPETYNEQETISAFFFPEGSLNVVSLEPLRQEDAQVMFRFAKVFGLVYRRFLDLQKAEAQAREAHIELALERIRTQALAMQQSADLLDIVVTMRNEFTSLGHEAHYFWHMRWLPEKYEKAMTSGDGTRIGMVMELPRRIHGEIPSLAEWEKSDEPIVVHTMDMDATLDYVHKMVEWGDFQQVDPNMPSEDDIRHIGGLTYVMARTKHGEIGYSLPGKVPEPPTDDINTLIRFAGAFDLAYRRFEDLKSKELQNREAHIELALERVRARTMAMQHSNELGDASFLLVQQVKALGIDTWGCAFNIFDENENSSTEWFSNDEGSMSTYKTPREGIFLRYYEAGQRGKSLHIEELEGKACQDHYEYLCTLPIVGEGLIKMKESGVSFPSFQIDHIAFFKYGYLLFITFEPVPEAHEIFKRFAKVFEQTYTRFLDLQKAEAQAKEAIKQSSLDRVRGEIASMRTTKDLERITPLIWKELTILKVPFIRCGVFIMVEEQEIIQTFLSSPDGHALSSFELSYHSEDIAIGAVKQWRKKEIYKDYWAKNQFVAFMQNLIAEGKVDKPESFQGEVDPPESLYLNFVPFKQGMLYVGNTSPLADDMLELVQSLADTFAIAFARYEDFNNLEVAKDKIENALSELKSAQSQLIQAEKMASLGELTAGIAHEIQNPLNFVNNFSEVSHELLEEMDEEIEKGDLKEAKAIASDVKQNLEKILHHGKRADAIVKGMLQHSRSSSGTKEPTDINALADEYLRLAFHGLRAKDKSFNAIMNTDFDVSIGKINVIPQDIGRVILNLITNAFYAVTEKKKAAGGDYEPTVTIITRRVAWADSPSGARGGARGGVGGGGRGGTIEVRVIDNGYGIPDSIKEKIFQPFFTTKPTGQGTGLGLSLAYDIVKAHGGELRVETPSAGRAGNEGEGSTFFLLLPV